MQEHRAGTRHKDRILDIYGLFAREYGGWVAVASLIRLLAELGADAQAVRSAASRMKRSGLLESERVDGRAGYTLSATSRLILAEGDSRIFDVDLRGRSTTWVMVLFSVPEAERAKRYQIRSRLSRLGFAPGPSSSMIAPGGRLGEARRILELAEVLHYTTFFEGNFHPGSDEADVAAQAWDLAGINALYAKYLAGYRDLASNWMTSSGSDRDAFVNHMNNVSDWRPLAYADPGLPESVTPNDWLGPEARELFVRLNRQLRPGAHRYYRELTNDLL